MTDSKRRSQEPDETTITKLGKQRQADICVIRHLYDEELEILQREAAVRLVLLPRAPSNSACRQELRVRTCRGRRTLVPTWRKPLHAPAPNCGV